MKLFWNFERDWSKIVVLTFKVKVKVKEVKVQNLIISIVGKDETCLKFWTELKQNYGL